VNSTLYQTYLKFEKLYGKQIESQAVSKGVENSFLKDKSFVSHHTFKKLVFI